MTEKQLEKSEPKSYESLIKWDGNPHFSHLRSLNIHGDGLIGQRCFIENLANSAEEKRDIFFDNLSVKKTANEKNQMKLIVNIQKVQLRQCLQKILIVPIKIALK